MAHSSNSFDGVQVFSATVGQERVRLGERFEQWRAQHRPDVVDIIVQQSSDNEFHCLSIIVFYRGVLA